MRQRQARHQWPLGVVGPDHRRAHIAAQRQRAVAPGEVRPGAPAPEREDAALARLMVEREGRAGQHLPGPEAHLEQAAAVRAAGRTRWAAHQARPARPWPRAHRPGDRRHRRAPCTPRHPKRRRATSRRAGHRTVRASAAPVHASRAPELTEKAEREVTLHAPAQLAPREPPPEARLPRRLQPFLHVLDHVHRRRPAETRQQRPRQRPVVALMIVGPGTGRRFRLAGARSWVGQSCPGARSSDPATTPPWRVRARAGRCLPPAPASGTAGSPVVRRPRRFCRFSRPCSRTPTP